MSEENKKLVYQFYEEIWNRGNLSIIDKRIVSDYVGHSDMTIEGPEGAKQCVSAIRDAFPDYQYTVEDEISDADKVVHRWTAHGTHLGTFQGIPPTGKKVAISGISIYRVANGKLIEGWTTTDLMSLMQQLGVFPIREAPQMARDVESAGRH